MKAVLCAVLILVSQATIVLGETLAEKQQRLEALKQQVAQLEKEIAAEKGGGDAATVGKAGEETLEAKLNSMPKNLYPADNENSVKRDLRNQWVEKNLKAELGPWRFTGKLERVDTVQRRVENPAPGAADTKTMVRVNLNCPLIVTVWGIQLKGVKVEALLPAEVAEQAASWATDGSTTLSVSGKVLLDGTPDTTSDTIPVKIDEAKLEK